MLSALILSFSIKKFQIPLKFIFAFESKGLVKYATNAAVVWHSILLTLNRGSCQEGNMNSPGLFGTSIGFAVQISLMRIFQWERSDCMSTRTWNNKVVIIIPATCKKCYKIEFNKSAEFLFANLSVCPFNSSINILRAVHRTTARLPSTNGSSIWLHIS